MTSLQFIGIRTIQIETFEYNFYDLNITDSRLQWTNYSHNILGLCHTMTLSESLIQDGIRHVNFIAQRGFYYYVYIHKAGTLFTDLPGAYKLIHWESRRSKYQIEHEIINVLDYIHQECNQSLSYRTTDCLYDKMYEVKLTLQD